MSRGRHDARLERLELGTPAAQAVGREIVALIDQFVADFGEAEATAALLPLFGLAEGGDR